MSADDTYDEQVSQRRRGPRKGGFAWLAKSDAGFANGGQIKPRPASDDSIPIVLSPGKLITDPDEAEALGLNVDAERLRREGSVDLSRWDPETLSQINNGRAPRDPLRPGHATTCPLVCCTSADDPNVVGVLDPWTVLAAIADANEAYEAGDCE